MVSVREIWKNKIIKYQIWFSKKGKQKIFLFLFFNMKTDMALLEKTLIYDIGKRDYVSKVAS